VIRGVVSPGVVDVDGPLIGTRPLELGAGLFVTWVPGMDVRSAAVLASTRSPV
jgi:hypothetical protein